MAVLSDADRVEVWAQFMRDLNQERELLPLDKPALRAAVNAIDAWVDANSAAFNAAIPQPARGALSARQKARLLAAVVFRRFRVT